MKEITNFDLINTFSDYKVTKNSFNKVIGYYKNDLLIGFIDYSIMYEIAELNYIFVLEDYRKNNIASYLMEYMIDDCINCNVNSITLEVRIDNKAIKLYEKYNFKQIGIRKKYYDGIDGLLMEKVIE